MPTLKNESAQAHSLNYAVTWAPEVTAADFYAVSGGAALHLLPGNSVEIPQSLADALTNAATSAGLVIQ